MTPSTKEIEDLVADYFRIHTKSDSLLEFMYSIKKDGHKMHGSLCVFGTNPRITTVSKTILPEKETVSNKEVNRFLNKFDDKIDTNVDYMPVDWKIYRYDNSELLKQNDFWKTLTITLNQRGYELEVFMMEELEPLPHRSPKTPYYEFIVGSTQKEDLLKQHKGKIGARSIGLLDHHILNFDAFINEGEENNDDTITDILRSLSRNYESKKFFYTDLLQFVVEEERRDWRDTRKYVELEKTVTHDATYKLKFKLDEKHYLLTIDFDFSFKGDKEKDAPENASAEDLGRLNVVLNGIDLKKIELNSSDMNFSTSKFSESLKKSATDFLVKMMAVDYDTLGAEIYSLQQK